MYVITYLCPISVSFLVKVGDGGGGFMIMVDAGIDEAQVFCYLYVREGTLVWYECWKCEKSI